MASHATFLSNYGTSSPPAMQTSRLDGPRRDNPSDGLFSATAHPNSQSAQHFGTPSSSPAASQSGMQRLSNNINLGNVFGGTPPTSQDTPANFEDEPESPSSSSDIFDITTDDEATDLDDGEMEGEQDSTPAKNVSARSGSGIGGGRSKPKKRSIPSGPQTNRAWSKQEFEDLRRVYLKMKDDSKLPGGPPLSTAAVVTAHLQAGYNRTRSAVRHKFTDFTKTPASGVVGQSRNLIDNDLDDDEDDDGPPANVGRKRRRELSDVDVGERSAVDSLDGNAGGENEEGEARKRTRGNRSGREMSGASQPGFDETSVTQKIEELDRVIATKESEIAELKSTRDALQKTFDFFNRGNVL